MIFQIVQFPQNQQIQGPSQWKARLRLSWLTSSAPLLVIITCMICYQMAVQKKEVPPYPNCYITETAIPTPQNIIFRSVTLPCASILGLIWITAYYVLRNLKESMKSNADISKRILYFGLVGIPFFIITCATIDSGDMLLGLHTFSAVLFFTLWSFNMIFIAQAYSELRKQDPSVISSFSLKTKWSLVAYFFVIALIQLGRWLFPESMGIFKDDKPFVPIVEWTGMWALCFYIFTFTWDWENYYFVLQDIPQTQEKNQTVNLPQNQNQPTFLVNPQFIQKPQIQMGTLQQGLIQYQ